MSRCISFDCANTGAASSAPTTQTGLQLRLRPHRRLDESAAAEPLHPVAVLDQLLGPLAALREDEHELALVVEEPVHVRRMSGDAADLRQQRREAGVALEEVLDGHVERPRVRVLVADRLADDRRVRRQGAGVVGDQQGVPPSAGTFSTPSTSRPEPVAVEELDERRVEDPLDPLRPSPVVEAAIGLDRGQQRPHPLALGDRELVVSALVVLGERCALGGHAAMIAARLRTIGLEVRALRLAGERLGARRPAADVSLGPRAVTYPYRRIELIEATPADGPDPYGDPDPEWLRIDWRPHVHVGRGRRDARHLRRDRRGPGDRLRPRPRRLLAELAREHAARWRRSAIASIAIDLPGFGDQPDAAVGDHDPPLTARSLEQLCSQLEVGPCTLVGNSMGGFIAAEIAVAAPAWVERLVLVSAAGISHATMRRAPDRGARPCCRDRRPRCSSASTCRRCAGRASAGSPSPGSSATPSRLPARAAHRADRHRLRRPGVHPGRRCRADRLRPARPALRRSSVPTLIVWGRDDLFVPATDAAGYARADPGLRARRLRRLRPPADGRAPASLQPAAGGVRGDGASGADAD